MENIAEMIVDFLVENMRENAVVMTTRPRALLVKLFTGEINWLYVLYCAISEFIVVFKCFSFCLSNGLK